MDLLQPYRGLRGKDLTVAVSLTPVLIVIWVLVAVTRPVRWAYDWAMTRLWGA